MNTLMILMLILPLFSWAMEGEMKDKPLKNIRNLSFNTHTLIFNYLEEKDLQILSQVNKYNYDYVT